MKFEEVLPALRKGKKTKRKDRTWENNYGWIFIKDGEIVSDNVYENRYTLTEEDLNTEDWEIVEEKKKVKLRDLTEEQFKKWLQKNCRDGKCRDCIFYNVGCECWFPSCWIKHKDLYSDKFLDQEIEIDEE